MLEYLILCVCEELDFIMLILLYPEALLYIKTVILIG